MFKVSDLSPDHISNYAPDEVYSDIENLMEYVIELQKYLAELTEIKHEYWLDTLPTSSFSHLFKEIQYFDLL